MVNNLKYPFKKKSLFHKTITHVYITFAVWQVQVNNDNNYILISQIKRKGSLRIERLPYRLSVMHSAPRVQALNEQTQKTDAK